MENSETNNDSDTERYQNNMQSLGYNRIHNILKGNHFYIL